MRPSKRWIVAPAAQAQTPDPALAGLPRLLRQLLCNRGLLSPADAAEFIDPKLTDLPSPERLPGCADAAGRIVAAVRDRRRIVIYGDYDVDGITGSAILWHAIRLAGGDVGYYVPHRLEEGYGVNAEALAAIARDGARMVVTVDCGITAIEQAQAARALGMDLIITDHHEPGPGGLPQAEAIVHPRLGDYPNPHLCGSGVALKLAWAIGQSLSAGVKVSDAFRRFLLQGVSLAALGTIADVVPLVGENRVLATYGLRSIKQTGLPGLDALIESAGLRGERVDAYHVGFSLAPRLNAAGRMDAARQAVEMFTEADPARCRCIADYLEAHNRDRQATQREILGQAIEKLRSDGSLANRHSIVLSDERWHPGVVGIVASRLVDRYNRPTVLIGMQNGLGQGSARSIDVASGPGRPPRFSISDALAACAEHLVSFGGHAMAGGVRLERERIGPFAEAFERFVRSRLGVEDLTPLLRIDAEVDETDLELEVIRRVAALAPFGMGNPHPVAAARGCRLKGEPRRVGRDGSHLQFHVELGRRVFKAIAFGGAEWSGPLASAGGFDVAFEPTINEYQGRVTVEMNVKDLHVQ